jgi:hypothetical protein
MPVIAYLDTGIYLHPIVEGLIDAVKIGYYNPPDMPRGQTSVDSIGSFVDQCMPGLLGAQVTDVLDVDQCDYDVIVAPTYYAHRQKLEAPRRCSRCSSRSLRPSTSRWRRRPASCPCHGRGPRTPGAGQPVLTGPRAAPGARRRGG